MKQLILVFVLGIFLYASEYEAWLKDQTNEYSSYKKSLDEEFTANLKKDWEVFKGSFEISPYSKPKPTIPPKATKEPTEIKSEFLPKVKLIPVVKEVEKVISPASAIVGKRIKFDFFGVPIVLGYDESIHIVKKISTKSDIANYFSTISNAKYQPLVEQLSEWSQKLSLNGWGQYLLSHTVAMNITRDTNSAQLLTWFLMLKHNSDVKVALDKNCDVVLLGRFDSNLYQVAYFTMGDGQKYFVLHPDGKSAPIGGILTYDGNYPAKLNALSTHIKQPLAFVQNTIKKEFSFVFENKKYTIKSEYGISDIAFFKTFPQSDYRVYFNAKQPPYLTHLLEELKQHIGSMDEVQAVNFLLRFTQSAFAYKTDDEQFSYEKVMMPFETLFYPFSDCEDRSIMFSFLVKNLLGLDIVGIKFHDHLATAIELSSGTIGDSFTLRGKQFSIADPTYINANIGMMMPQYKQTQFEIIE